MTLQAFYLGTWFLMVGLTLVLSALVSLTWPIHLTLAGFASFWALVGKWHLWKRLSFSGWGVSAICLGLGGVGLLLALDSRDWVAGLAAGLWSILPLFLYRGQRSYGHWLALFTVAALSLICVMIKEELVPFGIFLAFILVLVLNLNAMNLRTLAGTQGARRYVLPARYFRGLGPAFFWGAVTTALIFFFFPRTSQWANPLALRGEDSLTGYDGTVSLESTTRIRESDRVELQVVTTPALWLAARVSSLYFRGNTVEVFDGTDWTPSDRPWNPVYPKTELVHTKRHTPGSQRLEIFREQHRDRSVIYPGVLGSIDVPWHLTKGLLTDGQGNLRRSRVGNLRYAYEVRVSESLPPQPQTLKALQSEVQLSSQDLEPFLAIPRAIREAPYWKAWLAELDAQSWGPLKVGEVFRAINGKFQREFSASLIHDFREAFPLKGFLEERRGHCEYFATVAALTLRSLGIPTRLVLGFRGGVFNTVSQSVEVRAKNAHAWVEARTGNGEWSKLDPTPVILGGTQGGWGETWRQYSHALTFWFNRYVVQYNMETQRQLFKAFSNFGKRGNQPFSWTALGQNLGILALFVLGALAWRRWRPTRKHEDPAPQYYLDFLAWAKARGWTRRRGESLRSFHERVAGGEGDRIWPIDRAIHRDNYGRQETQEEERRQLSELITKWT